MNLNWSEFWKEYIRREEKYVYNAIIFINETQLINFTNITQPFNNKIIKISLILSTTIL